MKPSRRKVFIFKKHSLHANKSLIKNLNKLKEISEQRNCGNNQLNNDLVADGIKDKALRKRRGTFESRNTESVSVSNYETNRSRLTILKPSKLNLLGSFVSQPTQSSK